MSQMSKNQMSQKQMNGKQMCQSRTARTPLRALISHIDSLDPRPYERYSRRCLLDALGCILHGLAQIDGQAIIRGAAGFGEGPVPLPYAGTSLTPDSCALVLGSLCHLRELDDVHISIIHPGACVVPAAWSAGWHQDLQLGDLLDAIFAGYEAAARISLASDFLEHRERGWHATATIGPFGAALAVSRLLRLDMTATCWALGIAGTRTGGSWAFARDGAMTKRLHPGLAARDGLQAAFLARAGVSGPEYILEADDGGLFHLMSNGGDLTRLTAPAALPAVADVEFKWYASCKSVHSPLEAARAIYLSRPGAVPAAVKAAVNPSAMHMAGRMYSTDSVASAQLSIPYGVALGLSGRQGLAEDYTAAAIADPALYRLASLVELEVSADMDELRRRDFTSSAIVRVTWQDGGESSEFVKAARGSLLNPLDETALRDKFMALAGPVIGVRPAGRLADTILEGGREIPLRAMLEPEAPAIPGGGAARPI